MSNAKALMTNSAPIENNELKALRQQLTAQHSAKQIFKRGRLPQLEQNSRYHYEIHHEQTNLFMIMWHRVSKLKMKVLRRLDTNTKSTELQTTKITLIKTHIKKLCSGLPQWRHYWHTSKKQKPQQTSENNLKINSISRRPFRKCDKFE